MTLIKTTYNRRSFFKVSAVAGGGLMIGFNWLASYSEAEAKTAAAEWFNINGFIQIDASGLVTIMSPNPEVGQNIKTSMPMVVAEELDVAWANVRVKQAPLNTTLYTRQVAGGSQSLRLGWKSLRTTGATARQMLINAAAKKWNVDPSTCTVSDGIISNAKGDKISYGEIASEAVQMEVPKEVKLKDPKDFKIIGKSLSNVELDNIITGKPLFGLDYQEEGMLFAVALRPPAFGQKLESFDDTATRKIKGVVDVIRYGENKIAVLANSTWAAMKGQKALKAQWKADTKLESTEEHNTTMLDLLDKLEEKPKRNDGDVKSALESADKVIEKVYEGPFLPHNCLEPMNYFANVKSDKVYLNGPCQTPERTRKQVSELLKIDEKLIDMDMTRMGGGFGRRLIGDFVLEAAEISSLAKKPIKLVYTREDDMTAGLYRPTCKYKFKVAVKDNQISAYQLTAAGINNGNFTRENNFPAGVFANYRVDSHNVESKITVAPWRAPITNFLAFAEQAFIDEVAIELGKDPIQFRLDWFDQAKKSPIGTFDYDIDKYVGVIKLAAEKSNWGKAGAGVFQGFSAYYSHNTYVAEVAEVVMNNNEPVIRKIVCAIDCGIVVNPISALNQVEGGIIDGIGHALYGDLTIVDGKPQSSNFNKFRLIRMPEAPQVETHFVQSYNDPTGLGEPTLPPVGAAIANAIYAATGKRIYRFPIAKELPVLGG